MLGVSPSSSPCSGRNVLGSYKLQLRQALLDTGLLWEEAC